MRIQALSAFAVAAGLAAAAIVFPSGGARAAVCFEVWQPVCGTVAGIKRTFSNACFAKAAGARHVRKGECK